MSPQNYWVVKGNPDYPIPGIDSRDGDMTNFLPYYINNPKAKPISWLQYRKSISDNYRRNDLIFAWRSGRRIGIVGLGVAIKKSPYEGGRQLFEWKPLLMLPNNSFIKLNEIRHALGCLTPDNQVPRFTMPGIVQTIYEATHEQARIMLSLVMARVPLDTKTKQVASPLLNSLGKGGGSASEHQAR